MLRSKIGDRAKGGEAFGKRRVGMLKGHFWFCLCLFRIKRFRNFLINL